MLIRLLFGLILLFSPFFAHTQESAASYDLQKAQGLLSDLPKLRVFISRAPGFGHQAATVNLMRRLRSLGYKGEFEVIYDPVTQEKLSQLIPEFKQNSPETQRLSFLGSSSFTSEESFNRDLERAEKLPLGLTGADDQTIRSVDQLKVDVFLKLQPSGWQHSSKIITTSDQIELSELKKLPLTLDLTEIENFELALEEAKHDKLLFEKSQKLSQWIHQLDASLMMPIYGVGIEGADRMRGILLAMRDLMHQKQNTAFLPILSALTSSERAYIERGFTDITFVDVMTAEPHNIPRDKTIVLYVGRLPQRMFNLVLSKAEIAPSIAGKNAANLLHQLGKTYLNTVGEYPLEWSESNDLKVRVQFREMSEAFSNIHLNRSDDIEVIRQYLSDSLDPESELNRFFKKMSARFSDAPDGLIKGLSLTSKYLNTAPLCRQAL